MNFQIYNKMKSIKYLLIIALAFVVNMTSYAQEKKNLELADLYERPTFQTKGVRGMNPMRDGETYGTIEKGDFNIYNYKTGKMAYRNTEQINKLK